MTSKNYLLIAAVVAVLYGLAFVLMPGPFTALYGAPPEPHTIIAAQYFGSALIGLGVVYWFAKDFADQSAARGVLMAVAATTAIGGIISIWGVISGAFNALGWTSVVVYALLLLGALYCLLMGGAKKA